MNDKQIENINRYLENDMSPNERNAFEEQLRNDEALAQEFKFYQDFYGYVARQKPALRQDLSDFGDEYIVRPNQNKKKFPYWIWIPILLMVVTICYFSFFYQDTTPLDTSPTNTETKFPSNNSKNNFDENINENSEEPIETPKTNEDNNLPKLPPNQPIAVVDETDFEYNPILEAVIKETYRETIVEESTVLTAPALDAEFEYSTSIPIVVEGLTTVAPNYVLNIYSNRSFDIENDFPILNVPLSAIVTNNKQYRFRFNGTIPLKRGLYYLVIKDNNLVEILYIARFTVK